MNVVCVLRLGGDYGPEYVWALRRALNRHLESYDFHCLTDATGLGAWATPLGNDWPGWWSKVSVFRPKLFDGPTLYLDLDSLPVGDMRAIASYSGKLAVLSDFYRPKDMASGVMAFTPGPHTEAIYDAFCTDPRGIIARHPSRSDHWYRRIMGTPERLQDLYPGQIVSFKADARKGPPEGARLVCFHGKPRPNDPAAGWAHREWASLAREAA